MGKQAHKKVAEAGYTLSTANVTARDRREWLEDIICQEYTKVEVTPPEDGDLFNEITLYDWETLRLSVIQSHAIAIERLRQEPYMVSQDNYLAVVLVSGNYQVEQDGRTAVLQPGDMAIYDATRPHRIECSSDFSKLIVAVPRAAMRERLNGIEYCTATHIAGNRGVGQVTSHFLQNTVNQLTALELAEFSSLSEHYLDLLTLSLATIRPQHINLSKSRASSLRIVKDYVDLHLADPMLDAAQIAAGVRLSQRYINDLFSAENTSLMRYVWARRLECCRKEILSSSHTGRSISDIAFRWGFNDFSHFSRAFKRLFGVTPRDVKQLLS